MSPKVGRAKSRAALNAAPRRSRAARGEYCRDCWDKKIAVEEIVAREFALKRYIRAHSAEKYLIYHSTLKRPCGQLIVVDDGYDLFLTLTLQPQDFVAGTRPPITSRAIREDELFSGCRRIVVAAEVIGPLGRRQMAHGDLPLRQPRAGGLERRDGGIIPPERRQVRS